MGVSMRMPLGVIMGMTVGARLAVLVAMSLPGAVRVIALGHRYFVTP